MRFRVKKDAFLAFKNNEPYVLYYTEHNKKLVTAEMMSDGGMIEDEEQEVQEIGLEEQIHKNTLTH